MTRYVDGQHQDTGAGSEGRDEVAGQDLPEVSTEVTYDEICDLRDSQPVTDEFRPIYDDCVRALGVEPITGGYLHPADQKAARERVATHLANAKAAP